MLAPGGASSPGLLVAFRERVRFHQFFGLVDNLVLAVRLSLADTGLGPQVMVFVDAHVTFWRFGELNACEFFTDLVDVE